MTTPTSFSSQKVIENLRASVAQQEAKFLENESQLPAEVVETSRNNFASMYSKLDAVQKIRDNNPSDLSLADMMNVRNHLNEKIQQLNINSVHKLRAKNATSEESPQVVAGKTL